jgi:hypothetical protein
LENVIDPLNQVHSNDVVLEGCYILGNIWENMSGNTFSDAATLALQANEMAVAPTAMSANSNSNVDAVMSQGVSANPWRYIITFDNALL